MIRLIYISAPYTAHSAELVQANIERACTYGAQVRSQGAVPLVPHVAALPFLPGGYTLTQQALQAVGEGLWVDIRTLETGVEWVRP